eukprot:g2374.t1
MEGLPLDVVLLVAIAVVGVVLVVAYISRKLGSNQEAASSVGADGAGGAGGAGDAAPGAARHPGGECPICLAVEVVSPVQTNCGHWFCARCILGYYDGLGRVRIKCPLCRQEVTMLHRAAEDTAPATAPGTAAAAAPDTVTEPDTTSADTIPTSPPPPPPQPTSPETLERIARFNERNSGRRRSPWQVVEDAPLLLRRLWADLRRGDARVFGELIRRGVQLQLLVVALYILSPVDIFPESLLGIAGLVDDLVVAIVLLLHITTVYRTILLSWERSRAARAAAAAAAAAAAPGAEVPSPGAPSVVPPRAQGSLANSPMGAGLAAVFAVAAGAAATSVGAGAGAAAFAASAMGVVAAAMSSGTSSPSGARGMPPPLARDCEGRVYNMFKA